MCSFILCRSSIVLAQRELGQYSCDVKRPRRVIRREIVPFVIEV